MSTEVVTIDFETEAIKSRPAYPPAPVGLAIRDPGGKKEYMAWGHPEGNNCDRVKAYDRLRDIYRSGAEVLCHNGGFDLDVAECHFGLKIPAKRGDSLFLAFLDNPYERTLGLKPLAEKLLDMPPDEQDELHEWLVANVPEVKRSPRRAGEFIARAPGDLVGNYARGDVERTHRLRELLLPKVLERGMRKAYDRELALVPITLEMERSGIRVDVERLDRLHEAMEYLDAKLVRRIHKRLSIDSSLRKTFNINSGAQLAKALIEAGKLDTIVKTKTGKVSTKVTVLKEGCNDKRLIQLLSVHSVCQKYLTSFIRPWLEQAAITGGRILPSFNQVPQDGGGGARSGRYSSSDPNMQNISANIEESANRETLELLQKWLKEETGVDFIGLRDYLLPDEGRIICCTDFNQQELRIFAHFENDTLAAAYLKDTNLDVHTYIQQLIKDTLGVEYPRKHVKVTVFGILYGMGVGKLAARLGIEDKVARKLRDAIYTAIPGIRRLQQDLNRLAREERPLVTWGGRQYMCEPARYNKETGDWMSFEYKLLNYLVQPSSADYTKQAMLNVREQVPAARMAVQVHDELVCMIESKEQAAQISAAMCYFKLRVPMSADPKMSRYSWARASKEFT